MWVACAGKVEHNFQKLWRGGGDGNGELLVLVCMSKRASLEIVRFSECEIAGFLLDVVEGRVSLLLDLERVVDTHRLILVVTVLSR